MPKALPPKALPSLVAYMKRANKTQNDIAEALDVTQCTVSRYLSGLGRPSQETIEKMAREFGISARKLRSEASINQ